MYMWNSSGMFSKLNLTSSQLSALSHHLFSFTVSISPCHTPYIHDHTPSLYPSHIFLPLPLLHLLFLPLSLWDDHLVARGMCTVFATPCFCVQLRAVGCAAAEQTGKQQEVELCICIIYTLHSRQELSV